MATFVKDPKGWNSLIYNPRDIIGSDLSNRGRRLEGLAQRSVGKKTLALMKSINSVISVDARGLKATVGSDKRYALAHHRGTRPHEIKPRRAKTLRFMHHGKIRYAKRVYHPGTKPNPYLTSNLPRVVN